MALRSGRHRQSFVSYHSPTVASRSAGYSRLIRATKKILWSTVGLMIFIFVLFLGADYLKDNGFRQSGAIRSRTTELKSTIDESVSPPQSVEKKTATVEPSSYPQFQIYADTALISRAYPSMKACQKSISSELAEVKTSKNFDEKLVQNNNSTYLHFQGSTNNFVIRCFEIEQNFRIFIAGSSNIDKNLNREMQYLFDLLSNRN